ncbi:MAG: 2-polyprenyl-6-methoxyphenol hydroxylase-like FAD-dependent oxidoreductase, partial [Crocinitomicaceae bacterium]
MSHTVNTKVVIVGKGIAGLVLSILLKRKGIDHVVLDRIEKKRKPALAETLPPSTLVLLETLELKELFERSSLKTFGYHSLWGTHQVTDNNFFFHNPYKYGLKIAKSILLSDLEKEAGTEVISFQHLLDINLGKNAVQVNLRQDNEELTVNGEILIDATGRNRAV